MSKFDAVIADLKWIISNHDTANFAPVEEIENAIHVLEAAGKVEPGAIIRACTVPNDVSSLRYLNVVKLLRTALPDPEERKG